MRTSTVLSVLVALLFMSCNERGSFNRTEIVWDNWGVPHIYAQNEAEMYYAFGWAQMQSHANEIMRLYIESRGKSSEIRGEKSLQMDRLVYLYDLPGKAAAQYAGFEGDEKLFLDAFVKGLNDYAAAHPDEIDVIYRGFLPLTAIDVLAHSKRVINIEFLAKSALLKSNLSQ
jgi:acyl-homoserine-lactone acylase